MDTELLEPPAWVLEQEAAGITVVEPTAEILAEPFWDFDGWQPPDCACCFEPEPVVAPVEAVRWAVPGVPFDDNVAAPPAPSPRVQQLIAAAARLAATEADLSGVHGGQAMVDVDALLTLTTELRRHVMVRMADASTRRLHQGTATLNAWLSQRHPDNPTGDLTLAQGFRAFPALAGAVRTGQLSLTAGRVVLTALKKARPHLDRPDGLIDGLDGEQVTTAVVDNTIMLICQQLLGLKDDDDPRLVELQQACTRINDSGGTQLGRVEAAFVLLATKLPARALKAAISQQLDALLPSVLEAQAEREAERRNLTLHPELSQARVDADPELFELLCTVIGVESGRDPANPADTDAKAALRASIGEQEDADWQQIDGVARPRSRGQRMHDALKNALHRYLAADLAGVRDKRPVAITVTVSDRRVEGAPGALPAVGGSGRSIARSLLAQWGCDASVTPLLMSPGWVALGAEHTQRTLTAVERIALRAQHGSCAGQNCCRPDDPLLRLEPHHPQPYAKTGKTSLHDTIWACPRLHHDLHHGKTVQLRNGRWLNENGWTDPPAPKLFSYP